MKSPSKNVKWTAFWENIPSDRLNSNCSSGQSDQSLLSAWRNFASLAVQKNSTLDPVHPVQSDQTALGAHDQRYVFRHCTSNILSISGWPRRLSWMRVRLVIRWFQVRSPRRQHSFVEIDYEIFSTVILSLLLIQEWQLSVSGERMCTILVKLLRGLCLPSKSG